MPLGRLATPDEIADSVLFIASDRARFISGQLLCVDGGYSAGKLAVVGGLAFDGPRTKDAVADASGGTVWVFDAGGRLLARAESLDHPSALFFHRDGALWVAERGRGRIVRFTLRPRARGGG